MNAKLDQERLYASPSSTLAAYEKAKFELADILRAALRETRQLEMRGEEQRCQEFLNRLAADRFYVAVVGHFNRGKTTLMNAIAGADRLPTGVLPATSVITCLCYGSRERVLLRYRDSQLPHEIATEELARYISEQGNPGNRLGIELAEVQLPAEPLRKGLFLVDTPGLGSAIAANTRTTESFLPQADAILFVTSVEAPLSSAEMSLLRRTSELGRRIFLVLNKTDLVAQPALDEIASYVREQVAKDIPETPTIMALSARLALEAKTKDNVAAVSESHLPELEAALVAYLAVDRWHDFIHLMSQRTRTLLTGFPVGRAEPLLSRLEMVESAAPPTTRPSEQLPVRPVATEPVRPCIICEKVAGAMFRFLSKFQNELTTNERTRSAFAEQGGFCAFHGWQYERLASPAGIAMAFPDLLESLSARLEPVDRAIEVRFQGPAGKTNDCPACKVARASLEAALEGIVSSVERSRQAPDLCLPHFSMFQSRMGGTEPTRHIRNEFAARLARLAEDLKRFALKQDGLRRDLISEEERNAPGLSLNLLLGHKEVQPRRD